VSVFGAALGQLDGSGNTGIERLNAVAATLGFAGIGVYPAD
jgi:hypothetical protein